MNSLKYIFALIVSCITVGNINAQVFTEEQQREIQMRVKGTIEQFENGLSRIVNSELPHEIRAEYVNNTLNLFIGNGSEYSVFDEDSGEKILNSGVKILSSSNDRTIKKTQLVKSFIYKLYNTRTRVSSSKYNKINIDAFDAVVCDNVVKVDDHYECIAYYHTRYYQKRDGKYFLSNSMVKKLRCYIQAIELPTGEILFPVKLGDIYIIQDKL